MLLKNRFGRCIGGSHPEIKDTNVSHKLDTIQAGHVMSSKVEDFNNVENLGIECKPRCGGCKCGKCSLGSKAYTIKEERELEVIERNLNYDSEQKV